MFEFLEWYESDDSQQPHLAPLVILPVTIERAGGQIVIAGDPKQLPPTSFFQRVSLDAEDYNAGDDRAAVEEGESILDVASTLFQPLRRLRWHYRSRHHSLIAFSNSEFYQRESHCLPVCYHDHPSLGVKHHIVHDGVFESGHNPPEAAVVVEAVLEHMRQHPDESLGVVTLNSEQRELVEELLDPRLRDDPAAITYQERMTGGQETLFVKNLENVRGDERDLKQCLIFARTGILQQEDDGVAQTTNDFERAVGAVLKEKGYDVVPQVGVAGFFIDLGVRHPARAGTFLLGIECDGASYHSGRSARDRDRFRQEILENLGWKIHRIWSTDWFKSRDSEIKRLVRSIEELLENDPAYREKQQKVSRTESLRQRLIALREMEIQPRISVHTNREGLASEGSVGRVCSEASEDERRLVSEDFADSPNQCRFQTGRPVPRPRAGDHRRVRIVIRVPGGAP